MRIVHIGLGILFILVTILFFWFILFGPERYYIFNPYIDTEMALGYSPEKFDHIRLNMTKDEVIKLLGEPLSRSRDTLSGEIIERFTYTNDGKILYQKMPWYMVNDYAWYRSFIYVNTENKVIRIDKGWSYD